MKQKLITIIVFASIAVQALQIGELEDTTPVAMTDSEHSGNVSLVSLAKAQAIADGLSEAAALKMYHYGDPNQELTPDEAFGFDLTTGAITSYDSAVGGANVVIPYEIAGVAVEGIGVDSFRTYSFASIITNVVAPRSVSAIGVNAFYGCTNLVSIVAPGVLRVYMGTFDYCSALVSISFESCTTLNSYAFYGCESLSSVHLPSIRSVGSKSFMKCRALTSIDLSSATYVSTYVFSGCTNLVGVTWSALDPTSVSSTTVFDLSNVQGMGSAANVTNYVANEKMPGWGDTFNGRPVVRGSVSADEFYLGGSAVSGSLYSSTNWVVRSGLTGTNAFENMLNRPQAWTGTGALTVSGFNEMQSPVQVYWTLSGFDSVSLPSSVHFVGGGSWQTNAVNHFTVWASGTNVLMSFLTTTPIED